MIKRLLPLLVTLALLSWAPRSEVGAESSTGCDDGTLVYWHEMHYWVCMGYVSAGQACILCQGEPIDVVG